METEPLRIAKISEDYFIDSRGNIYSRPRHGVAGGIVQPKINAYGYHHVAIVIDGKKRTKMVHRLMAEAFIPNPENEPTVNHKDGNKRNNSLTNLEWCSFSENNRHAWKTGLRKAVAVSGEKYIYLDKITNRFRVMANSRAGKKNLGRFVTLQEAINARDKYLSTAA